MRTHRNLASILLIFALSLIVYLNSFHTSFHFDDYFAVTGNEAVRDAGDLSKSFWLYPGRFLLIYSFAVNYYFHGAEPTGYHVANFLFHLGNAILVYFISSALFLNTHRESGTDPVVTSAPLVVALLFAAHPIMTESVTYISGRTSSLGALFYLAAMFLYARACMSAEGIGERKTHRALYSTGLAVFFLSLWVKESNATLPLVLLIFDFYFVEQARWGRVKRSALRAVPFFVALFALLAWRKIHLGAIGEPRPLRDPLVNLLTQFRVIAAYLRLILFPTGQNIDHDVALSNSLFEPETLLAFLLLVLLGLGALALYRKNKLASFGMLWFFINLSPTSSVIPLWDLMSERWVYLPSIGVLLVVGALLEKLQTLAEPSSMRRRLIGIGVALVILPLSSLTVARNAVWKNEYTLWKDAVEKSPQKARPHANLGMALAERGELEGALREIQTALSLDPHSPETNLSLGALYQQLGRYDDAIGVVAHTLGKFPHSDVPPRLADDFAKARFNLGTAYLQKGDYSRAVAEYRRALELAPYLPWTHSNMGVAYERMGDYELAIEEYRKELELQPGAARVRQNLENARRKLESQERP